MNNPIPVEFEALDDRFRACQGDARWWIPGFLQREHDCEGRLIAHVLWVLHDTML